MTYQDIGHLFFPLYLGASAFACALCFGQRWRSHLWVAAVFGAYVILLFQFRFDGKAHDLGHTWYCLVAYTQLVLGLVAAALKIRAWKVVVPAAATAITINAAYLAFSLLQMPLPRQGYFVGINIVQCLEIGSLIVCAPAWPFLASLKGVSLTTRKAPWKQEPPSQRAAMSGTS